MDQGNQPIAHAARNTDGSWRGPHDLTEHQVKVGELAAGFARKFGEDWARCAGHWHDLGKFRARFQKYIRLVSGFEADAHIKGEAGKAPHSTAGAILACEKFGVLGRVLAYLIAGHHAGLYDWNSERDSLEYRLGLADSRTELDEALTANPPSKIIDPYGFTPDLKSVPGRSAGFALWVRMLFSCLVDADFLDTERYMNPERFALRNKWPSLRELAPLFDRHMAALSARAKPTEVNRLRADILGQCQDKARKIPGLFSLTVPTGGGKTLSSMAFALEHAAQYDKKRIIYVIPYTSIIEQTADIFRGIFGETVIEHHSNAESEPSQENSQSRLACENWDAPIIVTTNVQFFESLFASKTSRCRKLHNIVDSVVILDEAQLLPPEFLQPITSVLKQLTEHYGVTVVLSTATQPVLNSRKYFDAKQNFDGLDKTREIIDDPDELYRRLERVSVRLPTDWHTPTDWETLAQELAGHESVLAIVNRRQDARDLWQRMPEGTLHLSALMCGAHRSQVIESIKARLKAGIPTRVISTQLVEAGVDIDFPMVYRAAAGLDSIAQAAGRCNREGKLDKSEVVVFVPPTEPPPGLLLKGKNACLDVLLAHTGKPLERPLFGQYFERLYHACNLDEKHIANLLKMDGTLDGELAVNFRTAAEHFRLIRDEDSVPVIVLYRGEDSEAEKWIATLRKEGPERWLVRKLQRFTVNIHRRNAEKLLRQGDIDEATPGLFIQANDTRYHPVLGFDANGEGQIGGWIV